MKRKIHPLLAILLVILIAYGLIYVIHPMPFIVKLDIQSAEITDPNDIIIYKTEDPQKVAALLDLFKYNRPYIPLQQSSSWKKINPSNIKEPPNIGFIFKNDLGAVRYSFFVRIDEPSYVQIRSGFFLPWSKKYFPMNPEIANWESIKNQ